MSNLLKVRLIMNRFLQKKSILVIIFLLLQMGLIAKDKILIIHSYGIDNLWVQNQTKGIKSILGNQYEYYEFYMDTKKIPKKQFTLKAKQAIEYYKKIKPVLVFTTDDNALKLVGLKISKKTPLVFGGINGNISKDYPWIIKSKNTTGVLERALIKRSIFQIKHALDLKGKVLLMLGNSTTARAFYNEEFKKSYLSKKLQIDTYISGDFTDWKKTIMASKQKGYSMLMMIGYHAMFDKNNNHINIKYISNWISKNSPLPSFTAHKNQIGKNLIIGGMVIKGEYMGEDMGNIAKEILNTKINPSRILVRTQDKIHLIFSKSELDKNNLVISPSFTFPFILLD